MSTLKTAIISIANWLEKVIALSMHHTDRGTIDGNELANIVLCLAFYANCC
jgi:hypothetical protein